MCERCVHSFSCVNSNATDWIHPAFLLAKKQGAILFDHLLYLCLGQWDLHGIKSNGLEAEGNSVRLNVKMAGSNPILYKAAVQNVGMIVEVGT